METLTSQPVSALATPVLVARSDRFEGVEAHSTFVGFTSQLSHRLGVVGLLAGLGAVACAVAGKPFWVPLSVCAGCAMVACSAALLVLSLVPRSTANGREAGGLLVFTAAMAIVATVLMLVARLDVLHADLQSGGSAARSVVSQFFTPPVELPPAPP